MQVSRTLRLGTRRSLLAWAQSSRVARDVEAQHPHVRVELVGIDTRGDQIQNIPLSQVQGKEFFVAELDDALRAQHVDFTVHSLKDLSLDRPADFVTAAIPRRASVQDVCIFHPRALERRRDGQALRIGTSSPRRLALLPRFLEGAFPTLASARGELRFDWQEIRGNVNTRLSRLHESDVSGRQLDCVVLAWAGLERLLADDTAGPVVSDLLKNTLKMIVPASVSPPAPGQGALALECRREDTETRAFLASLHDTQVAQDVQLEREILAEWGGGCHQALGVSVFRIEDRPYRLVLGVRDGTWTSGREWPWPPRPRALDATRSWISRSGEQVRHPLKAACGIFPKSATHLWITHAAALPREWDPLLSSLATQTLWVPGWQTWQKLARRGLWVQGCSDGLGWHAIEHWLQNPLVSDPKSTRLAWLTHQGSHSLETSEIASKASIELLETYAVSEAPLLEQKVRESIARADFIYWKSVQEWERLGRFASPQAHHACGPGGTARKLRSEYGERLHVFPNPEVWTQWLSITEESDSLPNPAT